MKDSLSIKFKNEWKRLNEERSSVEHELCKLAFDIRGQFKAGQPGDAEFRDWCALELGLPPSATGKMTERAHAWECVRNVDHWVSIGGLPSARILVSLTPKQRMAVLSEALAKADERGRPVSAANVRDIAWRHGFIEKDGPRITEAKKAAALTAFVNRLYATVGGLPAMPPEIRAIVRPPRRLEKAA